MANKELGEIAFKVEGKEYTLRIDAMAMKRTESDLDKDYFEICNSGRITYVICMLRHALFTAHGDVSEEEAAAMVDNAGLKATKDALGKALLAAKLLQKGSAAKN